MTDIYISAEDQERIDALVRQFRSQVEHIYAMAYLAGAIAQAEDDRRKLKEAA